MNKIIKNTIIIAFILLSAIIFSNPHLFKKNQIENQSSYTTAVCNSQNFCEDYVINCNGNHLQKITPTGFSVQQSPSWTDPRGKKQKYCN